MGEDTKGRWFEAEPPERLTWAVAKLCVVLSGIALLLYLVIVPAPAGTHPLDPGRLGFTVIALTVALTVGIPTGLMYLSEQMERRRHARVGVFPDRLESASRQDARGKCRQESFPFVQVRVFYVMSYGVHLKTKPGAPGSSLLASRECRKEALQAYLAWCQDQGLNVNIREFTRSPLPGFIPRASVTEAAIDSTPGASAAAASHMD